MVEGSMNEKLRHWSLECFSDLSGFHGSAFEIFRSDTARLKKLPVIADL